MVVAQQQKWVPARNTKNNLCLLEKLVLILHPHREIEQR